MPNVLVRHNVPKVIAGAAIATCLGSMMPGCGDDSTPSDMISRLARHNEPMGTGAEKYVGAPSEGDVFRSLLAPFPAQAKEILEQPTNFETRGESHWHRWGRPGTVQVGAASTVGAPEGMDVYLPISGEDAVRLVLPDGSEIRVREVGAEGPVHAAGNALVYQRAGVSSFWTAAPAGLEEWLLVEAPYVRSGIPVAQWGIEGGTLRVMEDGHRAAVMDASGHARLWVMAPEAFAATGESINTSFDAEGNRLSLYVDAEDEEVLVDPLWTMVAPLSSPRAYASMVALPNGKALLVGGFNGTHTSVAELYDPVTNMWTSAGTAYVSAGHEALLLQDGRVLVATGFDGSTCLATAMLYNPSSNTWSSASSLATARCAAKMVLLPNGKVLVTGGSSDVPASLNSVEMYDPSTNVWTTVAPMLSPHSDHQAAALLDGRVFVMGGSDDPFATEIYNPTTNSWSAAASPAFGRMYHTLTPLQDGRLATMGGDTTTIPSPTAIEVYNPISNSWLWVTSLASGHTNHAATRLNTGQVLVIGGTVNLGIYAPTELFNPTTGTCSSSAPLLLRRDYPSAALLANGKVLVAGGQVGLGWTFTATAELYTPDNLGEPCASAAECQSGFCVDGVCCNSACGTATDCQQCNMAGSVGTCTVLPAATVCRASQGLCDTAEFCDGAGGACPADVLVAPGTVCRPAAGACDIAETCNGSSSVCPADQFATTGTVCRPVVDVCDRPEVCTGATSQCPLDLVVAMGTTCRAAADVCDVPESCNGVNPTCPVNAFVAAGTSCRPSVGACDLPETCNGMSADCPLDALTPAGTDCRASAGPCDVPESCTGLTTDCPDDASATAGTICRASAGPCDVEETCDGASIACPSDGVQPSGSVCRPAAHTCDVAEICNGSAVTCPMDALHPDGILCNDGNSCTLVDSCQSGQCVAGVVRDCSATNECEYDGACDLSTGMCVRAVKNDGTPCNGGTCQAGLCAPNASGSGGDGDSSGSNAPPVKVGNDASCHWTAGQPATRDAAGWILVGLVCIGMRRRRSTALAHTPHARPR